MSTFVVSDNYALSSNLLNEARVGFTKADQWFNTGAYSVAAFRDAAGRSIFIGRFGNADKGAIAGPGVWNVDLAAMKDFRLSTQVRFTFNVFITNLFNHADWGRPDTNVTSANYGKITSLNSDFPLRRVVLGGRLTF